MLPIYATHTHTHTLSHTEMGKKARKRNDLFAHFSHFYIFDCWAVAFNTFFSFRHIWRSMHDKLLRKLKQHLLLSTLPLLAHVFACAAGCCLSSKCTQEIPQITRRRLHLHCVESCRGDGVAGAWGMEGRSTHITWFALSSSSDCATCSSLG